MAARKIELEEVAALTKELLYTRYAGDLEQWFPYPCPDSAYLSTGEPLLFGDNVVREHFKGFSGKAIDIIQEEYFLLSLGDNAVRICGQILLESLEKSFRIINRFIISYRIVGGKLKMVHQHNTYEYIQPGESRILNLGMNAIQFVRSLLSDRSPGRRMLICSGTQAILINPNTVLYVQSQRGRTEFTCIDKVIPCNSSTGEIGMGLSDFFYLLRRSYLVNTLFIVAI